MSKGKERFVRLELDRDARLEPVTLPRSKSIAARALILSYVNGDVTRLGELPECDDTRELAAAIEVLRANRCRHMEYNLGAGGTSLRFFLALVASLPGAEARIECAEALRTRPIKPLIDALVQAGADIRCLREEGSAPLEVWGAWLDGTSVSVSGTESSQFRSALIMVSPLWRNPFCGGSDSGTVSRPYIEMTRKMQEIFKALPDMFEVEPDWSALSYFYEYALLRPGVDVVIENMPPLDGSLQGDAVCADIFLQLGVTTEVRGDSSGVLRGDAERVRQLRDSGEIVTFDMKDAPDLVPALAVGMCFAGIHFNLEGVAHLRHKESDRLAALGEELGKAGYMLETEINLLKWNGYWLPRGGECLYSSHGDHRIAMAMAVTAVSRQCVEISGFDAVTKSFPSFFSQLEHLGLLPHPQL